MNLLELIAKPIQSVKEALDLDPPSLTDQLIRIKNQLTEVQGRLDESRAIEKEKDALILQLQDAMKSKSAEVVEDQPCTVKKSNRRQTGSKATPSQASAPKKEARMNTTAKPKRQAQRPTTKKASGSKSASRKSAR